MFGLGKKYKSKDSDNKSKQQQNVGNGLQPGQHQNVGRRSPSGAFYNGVLSAGERTMQRAQIMAASRKRMNSDSPDYSINGAAHGPPNVRAATMPSQPTAGSGARHAAPSVRSNATADAAVRSTKPSPKTLTKAPRQEKDAKKRQSSNNLAEIQPTTAMYTGKKASSQVLNEHKVTETDRVDFAKTPVQKTPPLKDSPTLGYLNSPKDPQESESVRPQPSSDSGYGSAPTSSVTNSRSPSEINAAAERKASRVPRSDSGFVPKLNSSKEVPYEPKSPKNGSMETRPLVGQSIVEDAGRSESPSSGFVSRLDPGPTRSDFMQPLDPAKYASTHGSSEDGTVSTPLTSRSPNTQSLPRDEARERGRSTGQKPAHSSGSATPKDTGSPQAAFAKAQAQLVQSVHDSTHPARSYKNPQRSFSQSARASTNSPQLASHPDSRTYTLPSKPSSSMPQRQASAMAPQVLEPPTRRTKQATPVSVSIPPQPNPHPQTRSAGAAAPKLASMSDIISQASSQIHHSPHPQPIKHRLAESTVSTVSTASAKRLTLPPLSVLEGYKVNKKGHILDEEGEVIGELFEGDLIDCVRQRVNAQGEVLDERGGVVGRVRTIAPGTVSAIRWSQDSHRPSFQFEWLSGAPSPGRPSSRRDSNVSQPAPRSRGSDRRASILAELPSAVSPTDKKGKPIVAELDGSTDAEATPLVDQSDIFIPVFGAKRSDSPSTLNRTELAATERTRSRSKNSVASQDTSTTEAQPKKWASRYFEPGVEGGTAGSRRHSHTPDSTPMPKAEAPVEPKSRAMRDATTSPSGFRAVMGLSLEDLLEEMPTLSAVEGDRSSAGSPTPTLTGDGPRLGPGTPPRQPSPTGGAASRRRSVQFINGTAGLAPTSGSRSTYQPARRSPLANSETTPPSSGAGEPKNNKTNLMGLKRTYLTQSGRVTVETDDGAAPAPEIRRAHVQKRKEKKSDASLKDSAKKAENRKSRFSMMFGKKEQAALAQ